MNQQRCNHCMSVFDEALTDCPECGRDDALMYPFEAEHTPGPWTIEGEGALAHPGTGASIKTTRIGTGGWGEIELVDGTNEGGGGALGNARLIAAAPEMLEALAELADYAKEANDLQHSGMKVRDDVWADLFQATNKARAAISKAKGG